MRADEVRLVFIPGPSTLRAAPPLAGRGSTGRRHGKRGVAGAKRTDGGKHEFCIDCCLHTGFSRKCSHLEHKMLRPVHVGALFAAVDRYQVTGLNLAANQLGAEGGALVAAALKTNTTLAHLECAQLGRPSNLGH